MGKKKPLIKKPKKVVKSLRDAVSSDDDEIEGQLESMLDDEIEKYNTSKEESLKSKVAKKSKKGGTDSDDEEQEVYGLDLSDSENDEDMLLDSDEDDVEEEDNDEDILGSKNYEESGIPDSRAWGKKARVYHSTDYVDQDFGGFEGQDAEMAELEEAEAKEIQQRLTAELDESDFMDFLPTKPDKVKKSSDKKEILKLDFDSLTQTEKKKLIMRECPEVVHMLSEYNEQLENAKSISVKMETTTNSFTKEYYETKYHTILNYCINMSYFLYLRACNPTTSKSHPVVKKILQYRRLLDELNQINPEASVPSVSSKHKKSKIKPAKKSSKVDKVHYIEMGQQPTLNEKEEVVEGEKGKRGITYSMAKNKGLTPKRSKEQRNPRVKYRHAFKKAKTRRKGQVRTPRTENRRYEGELTGIKSHVVKSIKLK